MWKRLAYVAFIFLYFFFVLLYLARIFSSEKEMEMFLSELLEERLMRLSGLEWNDFMNDLHNLLYYEIKSLGFIDFGHVCMCWSVLCMYRCSMWRMNKSCVKQSNQGHSQSSYTTESPPPPSRTKKSTATQWMGDNEVVRQQTQKQSHCSMMMGRIARFSFRPPFHLIPLHQALIH